MVSNEQRYGANIRSSLRNTNGKNSFLCGCYVNCSFGIPCRQILALRQLRSESHYSVDDVIPRWIPSDDGTGDTADAFGRVIEAAMSGRPNEDVLDDELDVFPNTAGAHFSELVVRFKAALDLRKEIASDIAKYGAVEFRPKLDVLQHLLEILQMGVVPIVTHPDNFTPQNMNADEQERTDITMELFVDEAIDDRQQERENQQPSEQPVASPRVPNDFPAFTVRKFGTIRPKVRPAEGDCTLYSTRLQPTPSVMKHRKLKLEQQTRDQETDNQPVSHRGGRTTTWVPATTAAVPRSPVRSGKPSSSAHCAS